jgi:aminoglycoside phosphotransferase family enzyme/predicted kinase
MIETHISWVLLAGGFAYKIKKPVDLGFLDFSTLERRRFFCEEEIRLNARLAPDVYLGVVPVTGSEQSPRLDGEGEPIEYAVKMRRFDEHGLLSKRLDALDPAMIDAIADQAAAFHRRIPSVAPAEPYGRPEAVIGPMEENFRQIRRLMDDRQELRRIDAIERWTRQRHAALRPVLAERREGGFVRECHGDMHLGNMVVEQGEVIIFDGIEFNPALRWIDTLSEVAFLTMDLDEKGLSRLGRRFLDRYLERTGDHGGLRVLRFYQVYRAMVRAKVAGIRLGQGDLSEEERAAVMADYRGYVALAEDYTRPLRPALVLTHGVSGSGKSVASRALVESLPAVRVRSDVERKRLAGLEPGDRSASGTGEGLYAPGMTARTYGRLLELCRLILDAGFTAVADATFLERRRRAPFVRLAGERGVPLIILDLQGDADLFRRRVAEREAAGRDPSEATVEVLERQLLSREPLTREERDAAVAVPAEGPFPDERIRARLGRG